MGGEASHPIESDALLELLESQKHREINRMDQVIRSRLRTTGVQYNMKVILRGERGTGKTTLWKRFQGMKFAESYQPTVEIQSSTINWTFRNNCDNVKVEVWDVVDKAIKNKLPKQQDGNAVANVHGRNNIHLLDATIVDVYKDTHAVIFMVNPTSLSSLEYVREKAKEVPKHVSMLIVLGFKDITAGDYAKNNKMNVLTLSHVQELCCQIRALRQNNCHSENDPYNAVEPPDCADINSCGVFCLEVSLLNCFGLQKLHKYLDIPFLNLKSAALRSQLQLAAAELISTAAELESSLSVTNDYEEFEATYKARKRNSEAAGEEQVVASETKSRIEGSTDDGDDELKYSLNNLQLAEATIVRQNSTDSEKASPVIKLKMNHVEIPTASSKSTKEVKATQQKQQQQQPLPMPSGRIANHFESEVNSFQPTGESPLEGFLEPSDEDEKIMQKSKLEIRKYIKTADTKETNSRMSTNNNNPIDHSGSSSDEGSSHMKSVSKVKSTSKSNKIARSSNVKPLGEDLNPTVPSSSSRKSGKPTPAIAKPNKSSFASDSDEQAVPSTRPITSAGRTLKKASKKVNVSSSFPVEMDF